MDQDNLYQEHGVLTDYPEYYLSEEAELLLKREPPLPKKPAAPKEPTVPEKPIERKGDTIGVAILCCLGLFGILLFFLTRERVQSADLLPVLSLLFAAFLFLIGSIQAKKKYTRDIRDYEDALLQYSAIKEKYDIAKAEFEQKQERYMNDVRFIQSKEHLASFREEEFHSWCIHREVPIILDCDESDKTQRGIAENAFLSILEHEFEVYSNKKVPAGNGYFYPDIILISNGLYIDIEIDEPYAASNGAPIHYLNEISGIALSSVDQGRNDYMRSNGWEIIRFAEEQVFLFPNQCVGFIRFILNSLSKGSAPDCFLRQFFFVSKWSKERAIAMASQNYRSSYIPHRLIDGTSLSGNITSQNGTRFIEFASRYTTYDVRTYVSDVTEVQFVEIVFTNDRMFDEEVAILAESLGVLSSKDIEAMKANLAVFNRGEHLILDIV